MADQTLQDVRKQLAQTQRELDIIMQIDAIRDAAPEPMTMYAEIVRLLVAQFDAQLCMLCLIDPEQERLELKAFDDRSSLFETFGTAAFRELAETAREELDDITVWNDHSLQPPDDQDPQTLHVGLVPIIMLEELLGVLLVLRTEETFSDNDIALLRAAESQIDSAIVQGHKYYELQQRNKELETIYQIDQIRDKGLPFDEMLSAVLQELCNVIRAEMGFIMLYDQQDKRLEMRTTTHEDLFRSQSYFRTISQIAEKALQQNAIICQNQPQGSLRSIMSIPLILNDETIGVFGAANSYRPRGFDSGDQRLLHAIASQMDTAIFETLERRHLRDILGRSVDPRIMERLLSRRKDFLKGERTEISVLYADIRGSTQLAESTPPETLVEFINDYLGTMTQVILEHEGTLDKFVGDEVMALFGAPFPQEDHPKRAVLAGLAMQEAHTQLLERWKSQDIHAPIGVGIATGEAIVGEMGSPQRTDYTAIGRTINLGARICGVAKAGEVLVSQHTFDTLQDSITATPLPHMNFKGLQHDVTVYHVTKLKP